VDLFQNLPDLSEEQYSQAFQAIKQQPTLTPAPELIEEPVQGGVVTAGPTVVPAAGGEEGVSRSLTKRQLNDVRKGTKRLQVGR